MHLWEGEPYELTRRQGRALLYYLASHAGSVSRERLAFLLWPDIAETQARRKLTRVLSQLRAELPDENLIDAGRTTVSLNAELVWTDIKAFEDLLVNKQTDAFEQALKLHRGRFLEGFSSPQSPEFDRWLAEQSNYFADHYLIALRSLMKWYAEEGEYQKGIQAAQNYLAVDDLSEEVHRQLMRMHAAAGDRSAALRQYENCVLVLERELGVEPLPETRHAYERILGGEIQPLMPTNLLIKPQWSIIPSLEVPLIGREEAWESLQAAYARYESGGLILIHGEPGIGKSRLMQEFASSQEQLVLTGNCYASAQSMPYQPILQAMRQALSQPELWRGILPVWRTETARLLPEMGDIFPQLPPPIEVEPDQAQARLFEGLAQCFLGLAANTGVILCLDDLHWADTATLGWLAVLSKRLAKSNLCLLTTYRDEQAGSIQEIRELYFRNNLLGVVSLNGLSPEAINEILDQLPQNLPDPDLLAKNIARATAGNPFFVLETIRSLLDRGHLRSSLDKLPLAETIQEAVQQRLVHLSPIARQVLEAAAVLYPELEFDLIQETSGRAELEVLDGIEELIQRHLLTTGEPLLFRHDLLTQVVYQGLSPGRLKLLHRRAAASLGQIYQGQQDEVAVQMAQHYELAAEKEAAVQAYTRAAIVAQSRYAHAEAISYLERAIALSEMIVSKPDHTAQLFELYGDSLKISGKFEPAQEAYRSCLEQIPSAEIFRQVNILRKQARIYLNQRRVQDAEKTFQKALALLGPGPEGRDKEWKFVWLELQLARLVGFYLEAKLTQLDKLLKQIKPILDEIGTPRQFETFFGGQWRLFAFQERFALSREAVRTAEKSLKYIQDSGDEAATAEGVFGLGFSYLWSGDLHAAQKFLNEGLNLAEKIGLPMTQCLCLTYLSFLYRLEGRTERAREAVNRSLEVAQRLNIVIYVAAAKAHQAWLDWLDGNLDDAEHKAKEAVGIWAETTYPFEWSAHWILGVINFERDQFGEAIKSAKAMLHPNQQRLPDDVTAALEMSVQNWEAGRTEATQTAFKQAVELAKQKGYL